MLSTPALAVLNRSTLKRYGPVLAIGALLVFSFLVSSRGPVPFNGKLVACVGYGYGYGYTAGPPSVLSVTPSNGPSTGKRLAQPPAVLAEGPFNDPVPVARREIQGTLCSLPSQPWAQASF